MSKDWLTTSLLAIFLGSLGTDRFYTGHTGVGILKLIACGGAGVAAIIGIILTATARTRQSWENSGQEITQSNWRFCETTQRPIFSDLQAKAPRPLDDLPRSFLRHFSRLKGDGHKRP